MNPVELLNRRPRVLIVEPDPRLRVTYQSWLMEWGYEPVLALGSRDHLIRDARARARANCCSLAVIKMRLMETPGEADTSGLVLADELGEPVRAIITGSQESPNVLRKIVEKYEYYNQDEQAEALNQVLEAESIKVNAFKRGLQFDCGDILDEIIRSPLGTAAGSYPDQIADVIARLFPRALELRLAKLEQYPLASDIATVPRPTSIVLKVYEGDYEPYVVKLARAEKIKKEVDSYNQYISRRLTGNFTARLERYAIHWDIGAASYSYIGDFDVRTFSRFYEEKPIEDIEESLRNFFVGVWGKHYLRRHAEHDVSLFGLYSRVWGHWYEKWVQPFSPGNAANLNRAYQKLSVPEPMEWFKRRVAESPDDLSRVADTSVAITHGDLHGDNLLIDSRKIAWVIDFERCGEGHILQDFIELEADVFNRLQAHTAYLPAYFRMCLTVLKQQKIQAFSKPEIMSGDARTQKALETISVLRALARQITGVEDAREYLFGLLFNTIFRATIVQGNALRRNQSRALLLAGIICHRLDHWEDRWPPLEWEHLFEPEGAQHG